MRHLQEKQVLPTKKGQLRNAVESFERLSETMEATWQEGRGSYDVCMPGGVFSVSPEAVAMSGGVLSVSPEAVAIRGSSLRLRPFGRGTDLERALPRPPL